MRFFDHVPAILATFAVTVVAFPIRYDFPDDLAVRYPDLEGRFAPQVPQDERAQIASQLQSFHASLDPSHPAAAAGDVWVYTGYHINSPDDPVPHTLVSFHSGTPNSRNKLGRIERVYKEPEGVEEFDRRSLIVHFSPKVPTGQRPQIEAHVKDHIAKLEPNDPAKASTHAKVFQGYDHGGSSDPASHATVSFHVGSPKIKNKIGTAHHLYKGDAPNVGTPGK